MKCRHCAAPVTLPMADLGTAPPSNAYLREPALHAPERWYPLRVLVCERCWLVQTEDFAAADALFDADHAAQPARERARELLQRLRTPH